MTKHIRELAPYMAEVNKHAVLTREQELELAIAADEGDEQARERLIVCNLRFVVQVANQFKAYATSGKYSILDLVQEGNSGLVHAASKYDYKKGYRFITYAVWWIRARIMSFIIRSHSVVKLGTTASERKLFFKMGKVRALLDIQNIDEREDARKELAKELRTSPALIQKMEDRVFWHDTSLDKPLNYGSDGMQVPSLKDFLTDEASLEDQLKKRDLMREARNEIERSMKRLTEREREVIKMRYLGHEGQTLQAIANEYGLSRERIRQIESRAFEKMRPILSRSSTVRDVLTELTNTVTKEKEDDTKR